MQETIAIVGNGIISNKGQQIDSYDRIVRMNNYQINKFAKDVGKKHDIICVRPSLNIPCNSFFCNEIWFPWKLSMCLNHPKTQFKMYVDKLSEKKIFKIPDALFWNDFLSKHNFGENKFTTTGFVAVNYAIYLNYKVSIFGFDGCKSGHYFNLDHKHYQESHNFNYEWETLQQYQKDGLITIC